MTHPGWSLARGSGLALLALGACSDAPPVARAPVALAPLARFTLREPLERRWTDELIHFDADLPPTLGAVELVDGSGAALPAQIEPASPGRRARVWTALTLDPNAALDLTLRASPRPAPQAGAVAVRRFAGGVVLANDRFEIALPSWAGPASDLTRMAPPIRAVRRAGGAWIGEGAWINPGPPLAVSEAETRIEEEGPVLASVRQRLRFADGRSFEALISLGARQDAAEITETSDAPSPAIAHRLRLPESVVWQNQWKETKGARSWEVKETRADRDQAVFRLRPWSFWWMPTISNYAAFGPLGGDTMVGVIPLSPSRWSPPGWDGFERTEIPVATRAGLVELTFSLAATRDAPLSRRWAISASAPPPDDSAAKRAAALRLALVKRSELPLDMVKEWGFDATITPRPHPSLLFDAAAVARARARAASDPAIAALVRRHQALVARCGDVEAALQKSGPIAMHGVYRAHGLDEHVPELYLATGDPQMGRWLAAAVEGQARRLVQLFFEAPERTSLGANGPWMTHEVTRLVIDWDIAHDLIPEARRPAVQRALVLGAHLLDHPDYWDLSRGLSSANPNMTSAVYLPRGLVGAALAGHPEAERWVAGAEAEIERELASNVSPGGAWIESPGYQAASLDAIMLLASALASSGRRDLFRDPRLQATLDYSGHILTAPDRRFADKATLDIRSAPMTQPSVGHTFPGWITPFHGWAAGATARTDPAFSARQQFFWKRQSATFANGGRGKGLVAALTDPDLPESPPVETARAFPGFGSVMRTSWTDPRQSYVLLRTGPNEHHYDAGEHGSIVYYAKGAPLCLRWGNVYHPVTRWEPWYHNAVSFERGEGKPIGVTGKIVSAQDLPGFLAHSHGETRGSGSQQSDRHLLLVQAPDPLGANYLLIRDRTRDGQAGQAFHFNLYCLTDKPALRPGYAHFPGRTGVDLDLFFLSPDKAPLRTDSWSWKQHIYHWGVFEEEQHGVHADKLGSREDFFTVLYPRAPGERAPAARAVMGGAAARVEHGEGVDWVLLSPGRPTSGRDGEASLRGEIALGRRTRKGALRLAVMGGEAEIGGFTLASGGPTAISIEGAVVTGVSSGAAHEARVTLPAGHGEAVVRLDGAVIAAPREGRAIVLALPEGVRRFTITRR